MFTKSYSFQIIVAGAIALGAAALASAPASAAGLLVAEGGFGGVLEMKEHDVRVTVNNGIVVTHVEQTFVNTEKRIVEALYTFPVPKGATVSNFSMWINGKEMIGEVVEKKRARQIYESYKQTRVDPGLLEQVDYKTFEMRIFPIAAGAEQRVRLTYSQELDADHDWATYVYPLATSAKKGIDQRTTGRFSLTMQATSEVPFAELRSPSHGDRFVVVPHNERYYEASMEVDGGDLSRDVVIAYRAQRARTGVDVIASNTQDEDGYFMLTLTAGKELESLNKGMDYVFIVDVSGSMARDGKLGASRESVAAFVNTLGDDDRFDVMAFNVTPTTLFNQLTAADAATRDRASDFLRTREARGGTILRPAVEAAYRYADPDRTLNVVILSDGMTEQGEQRELIGLIRNRPAGSRVFCVGVGNEVNRPLLQQIATDAGGLAAFVSRGDDFERQAKAFGRKLKHPALADVRVGFDGAGVYDVEPMRMGDLFHGTPLRVYGRYRGSGDVTVTLTADLAGETVQKQVTLELPKRDDTNPQIERMWALRRVNRLMDEARANGSPASVTNEIVSLCEGYSIVSEYASFIVLENDAEYRRWKIDRRNASRIQRDRAAEVAVRQRLERMRADAAQKIGPASADDAKPTAAQPARPTANANPQPTQTRTTTNSAPQRPRSRDIGFGGGGGGGAIDPISGTIVLSLGAWGLIASRKRRAADDARRDH